MATMGVPRARRRLVVAIVVVVLASLFVSAQAPSGHAVVPVASVAVGGRPSNVALDPVTGVAYVGTNEPGVTVVDGRADPPTVIGEVVTPSFSQVAVDPATGRVVAASAEGRVIVFDGRRPGRPIVAESAIDTGTGGAAIDTVTGRAFISTFPSGLIEWMDVRAENPTPGPPVAAGTGPNGVDVDASTGRVFVANQYSSSISVLDGRTTPPRVTHELAISSQPRGLAVDPFSGRVFVTTAGDQVFVVDGRAAVPVVMTDSIGVGSAPWGVAVNASTGRLFVNNSFSDTVSVIDIESLVLLETVPTVAGPSGDGAADIVTNRVFIPGENSGAVAVFQDADASPSPVVRGVERALAREMTGSGSDANTTVTCAEGSVRSDDQGMFQMYVTLFSDTAQDVVVSFVTNRGTFSQVVALAPGVRQTLDVNALLTGGGVPELTGLPDVDTSVKVVAAKKVFVACPVYFWRSIGIVGDRVGPVAGGTVQDGSHG